MIVPFTLVGVSDEHTSCDCCGKAKLKRTVSLRRTCDGEVVHYGVSCAAKALKVKTKTRDPHTFVAEVQYQEVVRMNDAVALLAAFQKLDAMEASTGKPHQVYSYTYTGRKCYGVQELEAFNRVNHRHHDPISRKRDPRTEGT